MDTKRFLIGTIVGGIVLFVMGYVLFELLLGSVMDSNMVDIPGLHREVPVYWALVLSCFVYAALICYAMGRRGATGLAAGAKVGAVVGLLLWLTADLMTFAFMNSMTQSMLVIDPLLGLVHAAIAGAVIGLVDGKLRPAAA